MCGRYTLSTKADVLETRFHAALPAEPVAATYNAAPSQALLTILNENPHEMTRASWGYVPAWAAGRPDAKPVINARTESVATKPYLATV